MSYDVAVVPGDGIGIEVVNATIPLLNTVAERHGFELNTDRYDWGSHRHIEKGSAMPDDAIDILSDYDAILHGATGHPDVPDTVGAWELVIAIRRAFDQYVNYRPAYLFNEAFSPLAEVSTGAIDIHWIRENSEGEYADIGGGLARRQQDTLAVQTSVYTREGVERIIRHAFEFAIENDLGKVTSVTKSNAQRFGPVFWDEVAEEISKEFPDVAFESVLVDAMAQHLVVRPEEFEVVVASNLFSDIHTDLTAAVIGGLGLTPSANLNPDEDVPGMFEPVHGSAPDIAGKGIANPIAEVLSAALMLENLGEEEAATAIWQAVEDQLSDVNGPRTVDIGGTDSTQTVVDDLIERIRVIPESPT